MQLSNTIALITGGAHRVGRLIALELAQAGAGVVIHYHQSAAAAQATVEEIRALGRPAWAFQADLREAAQIDALFAYVATEVGRLHILINSAASMDAGAVLTLPRTEWENTLALNLTAPFLCAQHAAQLMLAADPTLAEAGVILNVADVAGLLPWANYPAHSVSKAGLIMLTQVLAKALAPRIRVNALAPGVALKPETWSDAQWHALAARTLLKRPGSGYDVAHAARFLIENDSITGETLVLDSGRRWAT